MGDDAISLLVNHENYHDITSTRLNYENTVVDTIIEEKKKILRTGINTNLTSQAFSPIQISPQIRSKHSQVRDSYYSKVNPHQGIRQT